MHPRRFAGCVAATITGLGLFLGGCASTPTQPASMAVTAPLGLAKKHEQAVAVNVTGGKETNPAWTSQISDADFKTAIETSIRESGLFAQVIGRDAAAYALDVQLARVSQPIMGFDMTVTLEVNWILTRASDKAVVWQKGILSTHTATTGDAFVGATRLRMATEGAARKNIEQALQQLSELNLEP